MFFKNKGVLGINARNLLYIRPYNKKKAIKLADDKIKTKQFLAARGVSVPKLYGSIKNYEELEKYDFNNLPSSFVLKPSHGFGGEGIIPIIKKDGDYWITAGGKKISIDDITDHIKEIIDGRFSISNVGDTAFFEQYIVSEKSLAKYSYEGLPDIRVVVHNLIPVMAMLRLPTKESGGKANLHQGAIAVGIDISRGEATHIAYKNKIIEELPDGLGQIKGLKIPHWDEILYTASQVQLITNLGYLAIDIAIDKNSGPVLLEINARAGLGVQVANLAPLRKRLERIEGITVSNPIKGVRIAKDMFGNIIAKEIENISGKNVIGTEEKIEIIMEKGTKEILAKINTGKGRSVIDEEFAKRLGLLGNTKAYDDEKSTLKTKFSIKNKRIQTIVDVEKISNPKYKVILGNRDLTNFLIDTNLKVETAKETRQEPKENNKSGKKTTKINYKSIDQRLAQIDNKIKLLYHLRPINLEEQKKKFLKNRSKNPQFEYPRLSFDPLELNEKLEKIETDGSKLGQIFEKKKIEILKKIALLESIDEERFTENSIDLFGKPKKEDVKICQDWLKEIDIQSLTMDKAIYNSQDAKIRFEKTLKKYGLKNWKVRIKESMVADCVAGKNDSLLLKKDASFTRERLESLIVHEIETHILTAENGKMQPYEIFNRGLAGYLTTQEGMAMYNVEKQRHIPFKQNYKAIAHVIAIDTALQKSFIETFDKLLEYGIPIEQAFRSALKAKRGLGDTSKPGAFTKDYIYYKGHKLVKEFIEDGGKMSDLYIGKIAIKDNDLIKELKGITPPKIFPTWIK